MPPISRNYCSSDRIGFFVDLSDRKCDWCGLEDADWLNFDKVHIYSSVGCQFIAQVWFYQLPVGDHVQIVKAPDDSDIADQWTAPREKAGLDKYTEFNCGY